MPSALSADDLLAYHRATRCPLSQARRELMRLEPELRERVLIASRSSDGTVFSLTDPIEQDPVIRRLVRQAASKAEKQIPGDFMGKCHLIWKRQAEILWEENSIRWFSPAQMNPGACFD
jgi:hypothetical protein